MGEGDVSNKVFSWCGFFGVLVFFYCWVSKLEVFGVVSDWGF